MIVWSIFNCRLHWKLKALLTTVSTLPCFVEIDFFATNRNSDLARSVLSTRGECYQKMLPNNLARKFHNSESLTKVDGGWRGCVWKQLVGRSDLFISTSDATKVEVGWAWKQLTAELSDVPTTHISYLSPQSNLRYSTTFRSFHFNFWRILSVGATDKKLIRITTWHLRMAYYQHWPMSNHVPHFWRLFCCKNLLLVFWWPCLLSTSKALVKRLKPLLSLACTTKSCPGVSILRY